MSRASSAPTLVKALQGQVKALTTDLRERSDTPDDAWGQQLKAEYENARARGRTGLSWSEWRDGEVDLAAVAWVLASVFIRFSEDNGLIDGPWITGPGARHAQAADNETEFYRQDPTRNTRDWLRAGFTALAQLPAGRDLVDPDHNLVWRAAISADAASALLGFWREQNADGTLVHDLTDQTLDTRFLGDLYQDLSDYAKKKYALLQTPVFVEEFILDRTLTPAINEFGLDGLKLIDPTCGSGHFLLGAFARLNEQWQQREPGADPRVRVQKALDSIHGVDLNPFAVAIARFRLTIAAMQAAGITRLKDAPAFTYHLVVGDSLLYGHSGVQGSLLDDAMLDTFTLEDEPEFQYGNEDIAAEPHILDRGRYHVVVGNPPYITVKDKALNEAYRKAYKSCHRKYALSVPFMELFFELAIKGNDRPAGFVGQVTANSFMRREFGKPLVERLLSGLDPVNPVDLTLVVDTAGASIPGHGTPTVIIVGRRRQPSEAPVAGVLGIRGEPGQPEDPAEGLVWTEIKNVCSGMGSWGTFVAPANLSREQLGKHPWAFGGGGAVDLLEALDNSAAGTLADHVLRVGFFGIAGVDDAFVRPRSWARRRPDAAAWVPQVVGDRVRDYAGEAADLIFFPYSIEHDLLPIAPDSLEERAMWPYRTDLWSRPTFAGRTYRQEGKPWYSWHQLPRDDDADPRAITYAEIATHNQVALVESTCAFNRSAPVIKLRRGSTMTQYLELVSLLGSSTVAFWLKQVCQNKGSTVDSRGARQTLAPWEDFYQFNASKWKQIPMPPVLPRQVGQIMHGQGLELKGLDPRSLDQALLPARSVELRRCWWEIRRKMVFQQEELDWEVYQLYGLVDEDLTYAGSGIDQLELGQRAFEIALARQAAGGSESTSWFERHAATPIADLPASWPADYRDLVERRLDLIASDPFIGLLERPEYKRRWQSATFDDLLPDALRDFILDKLEDASLWSDGSGPAVLSVAQLADRVRGDESLVEAVRLLRGAVEVDLTKELGALLAEESVPYLAAHRYKDSGLRKRAEWEAVWELQRREDAGETVSIPVPPKYGSGDFRKTSYWKARGKLDVPKERFVSYPGVDRAGDSSLVVGWAGWNHLDQARALARLVAERSAGDGLTADQRLGLVAGLVELEPWLHQWYADPDVAFGGMSPASIITGFIDTELSTLSKTRTDAKAWRP